MTEAIITKQQSPVNDMIALQIIEWDLKTGAKTALYATIHDDGTRSFERGNSLDSNPYKEINSNIKSIILREFMNVLMYEGFTCKAVSDWEVDVSKGLWSTQIDTEELFPFSEVHIRQVINAYQDYISQNHGI